MSEIVTIVSAWIPPDGVDGLVAAFNEAVRAGLPVQRRQTMLLCGEGGDWRVVTVWSSRADLDAYVASVDEPFAWRLLREAGGDPSAQLFEVVATTGVSWWP